MSLEARMAGALRAADPVKAMRRIHPGVQPDGVRIAALLVAQLRMGRLIRGSADADAWLREDPKSFAAAFRRYHAQVPPTAFFPKGEAALFRAWCARRIR